MSEPGSFWLRAEVGPQRKALVEPDGREGTAGARAAWRVVHGGRYGGVRRAECKCPRTLDFTDALPRDPNGTLYKRKLGDPYWASRERRI